MNGKWQFIPNIRSYGWKLFELCHWGFLIRNTHWQRRRRSNWSGRHILWIKGGQIGWLLEVKPHECDSSILEIHSVANREPMHIRTNRRGVAKMRSLCNDPSKQTFCYEPRKFSKRTENIHVTESLRIRLWELLKNELTYQPTIVFWTSWKRANFKEVVLARRELGSQVIPRRRVAIIWSSKNCIKTSLTNRFTTRWLLPKACMHKPSDAQGVDIWGLIFVHYPLTIVHEKSQISFYACKHLINE